MFFSIVSILLYGVPMRYDNRHRAVDAHKKAKTHNMRRLVQCRSQQCQIRKDFLTNVRETGQKQASFSRATETR